MRNVGNMVPPATVEGASTGDLSEASAIEYAVLVLKVHSIVVCGHSECGAMKAALAGTPLPNTPNLAKWLHHSASSVFRLDQEGPLDPRFNRCDQLSQLNVLVQLEHLATYPIVRERIADKSLHMFGWWFDIAKGDMYNYQRETRRFEIIDRTAAERLISKLNLH
jgi:carbonic anhydrase